MSLHEDLLEQAKRLLDLDDRRPKQASLRRAVSTAYYALFHLLAEEVSTRLTSNLALRSLTRRALVHTEMKTVSGHFLQKRTRESLIVFKDPTIPIEVSNLAELFIEMQTERHRADYKTDHKFKKSEVKDLIARVKKVMTEWQSVRTTEAANAYLVSLLLWKKWKFDDVSSSPVPSPWIWGNAHDTGFQATLERRPRPARRRTGLVGGRVACQPDAD